MCEFVLDPLLDKFNYRLVRADLVDRPGVITTEIVRHLLEDELVIADLTGHNANVFYELGIRHCLGKPVIQVIEKHEALPFDVAGTRTIEVDLADLRAVAQAKERLEGMLRHLDSGGEAESPVSIALDVIELRRSENPAEKVVAEIRELIVGLKTDIERGRQSLLLSGSMISTEQLSKVLEQLGYGSLVAGNLVKENLDRVRLHAAAVRRADDFLMGGRWAEAIEMYDRALAVDSQDDYPIIGKAKALKRLGQNSENSTCLTQAVELLSQLILASPKNERAYYNRACYRNLLIRHEAVPVAERAAVFADLELAIEGFDLYREMALEDPDLSDLRDDKRFIEMVFGR